MRNPLIIHDLTEYFSTVEFKPFKGRPVRGIVVPDCAGQSKGWYEKMLAFAMDIGMKGLGYITVQEDGSYKGPIDKFLSPEKKEELRTMLNLKRTTPCSLFATTFGSSMTLPVRSVPS